MDNRRFLHIGIGIWTLAIAGVAICGIPGPATFPTPKLATDVLRRYLSHGDRQPMNAVVVRRVGTASPVDMHIKVTQDRNGRRRMTVLHPLNAQGQVVVDDGNVMKSYCPDSSRFTVLPSPRIEQSDAELRLKLTQKNYKLAVEKNVMIAGRPAFVVVAVPKAQAMPTRKISVDAQEDVLLRVEAVYPGGGREMLFDTKAIEFPKAITTTGQFVLEPTSNERTMRYSAPLRVTTPQDAKKYTGFTPIFPNQLAMGFVPRGAEIGGQGVDKYVAIRLTDGIVTASLYQWDAKSRRYPLGPDPDGMDRTIDGIRMRLIGELTDKGRIQIFEGIANLRGKTFRPLPEPKQADRVLPKSKMPEGETVEPGGAVQPQPTFRFATAPNQ